MERSAAMGAGASSGPASAPAGEGASADPTAARPVACSQSLRESVKGTSDAGCYHRPCYAPLCMSARRRLATAFCVAALAAPALQAASLPPRLRFRSLSTHRVTVHFHQGLEATAREAAALATEILDAHTARYRVRVPRVQVVLVDASDDPNGYAVPFPYPLVQVRAAAPDGSDDFGNYESWLRLVLVHELAHVVHLEEAHGLFGVGRKLFGRAPFLFPNALT